MTILRRVPGTALLALLFLHSIQVLATERASVSGQVVHDGVPVCAMVLANGQYMFSCGGNGEFNLAVPLDERGEITLFAFAAGFAPYQTTLAPEQAVSHSIAMETDNDSPALNVNAGAYYETSTELDVDGIWIPTAAPDAGALSLHNLGADVDGGQKLIGWVLTYEANEFNGMSGTLHGNGVTLKGFRLSGLERYVASIKFESSTSATAEILECEPLADYYCVFPAGAVFALHKATSADF